MQDEYVTQADVPGSPEDGAASAFSTTELTEQLEAARARADDNYSKFLLAMADFENYKKRRERDFRELATAGTRKTILAFLPVLDNLERALIYNGENAEALRSGLQKTMRQFENILAAANVKPIEVRGKPFDPTVAEAIATREAGDGVDDDTILEEAEKGYTIGEDLLRPAKVIVAKHAAP